MLTSFLAMQNAMAVTNMAQAGMMSASDRMLNAASGISVGNSQPLRPSFSGVNADELFIKANETKVTVMKKLAEALEKKTAKDIKNSAPKYAGIDYKA